MGEIEHLGYDPKGYLKTTNHSIEFMNQYQQMKISSLCYFNELTQPYKVLEYFAELATPQFGWH
jgi:hypothetical protein